MDCGNRPADRENEGAAQIEKSHKGFDGDHDGSACEILPHPDESTEQH
ncbi:hypothetical protein AB4099_33820 [Bosea sp. 2KB_26]